MLRLALALATLGLAAPAASADVTQVSVTNLASAAQPSEIPQPPVVVAAAGTCATPMTVVNACPAGSWPAIDGEWGQRVAIAAGDTLELTFDAPVANVRVAATTIFPVGLTDPSGTPVGNDDVLGGAATPADATGLRWTVRLPDAFSPRASNGLTFSIVASGPTAHDFGLRLQFPRASRYGLECEGNTFFAFRSDQNRIGCDTAMPPGIGPTMTDPSQIAQTGAAPARTTPALTGAPHWTKRGLSLKVTLPANTRATVELRAGTALLGRANLSAAAKTERTLVVPVRTSNRHRHAKTLHVRLSAQGLRRVEATLKLTRWPRLRIG